ncbi:MAG TPA: hypothetical protein VGI06_14235 [Acidimicrobiales bacterium]|jgi:hypothetical protein
MGIVIAAIATVLVLGLLAGAAVCASRRSAAGRRLMVEQRRWAATATVRPLAAGVSTSHAA